MFIVDRSVILTLKNDINVKNYCKPHISKFRDQNTINSIQINVNTPHTNHNKSHANHIQQITYKSDTTNHIQITCKSHTDQNTINHNINTPHN
jgi:hypothetical protein